MIFNLCAYLRKAFPSIVFIAEYWSAESPPEAVLVHDTGGEDDWYTGRRDARVQFVSRATGGLKAKDNILLVYEYLRNRYGVILPEVTVDEVVYPELKTYRIAAIQMPYYLGLTTEKRPYSHEYTLNMIFTLGYSKERVKKDE